jgi:cytochrome c peroxidase
MQIPKDNAFTKERIELGKKLFFSTAFSSDGKISCSSCHNPAFAFADTLAISPGVNNKLGFRNSPSLVNIAWHTSFMLDGGVPTLEMQVLAPFAGHEELNFSIIKAAEILQKDSLINNLSHLAYSRDIDAYVVTRALACYQRSLIDGNSKFDKFILDSISNPLSESEILGYKLFISEKTGCKDCHTGILFSNYAYENIGLYENYIDSGRARITFRQNDNGKFKVPSLRNISLTAPYMHDGSLKTLEDVVAFYETGGKTHKNKSSKMKKIALLPEERIALVDFMKTLTGNTNSLIK